VRGLTDEEREALIVDATYPDDVMDRLVARGLLRFTHNVCCSCGDTQDRCGCEGDEQEVFDTTTTGHLALRLDSAARAFGMVTA
jgi:hypothetical protein